jgi:hypothetical protein
MNKPVSTVPTPPSPSPSSGRTTRDTAAKRRFLSEDAVRQSATRFPHGSEDAGRIPTHARRKVALIQTQFSDNVTTLKAVGE